jgi:hypothetical protein
MATLLTARCQDLAAPFGLHSGAEAMGLMAPAHFGLKGAFGQRCSSLAGPDSFAGRATQGGLRSLYTSRQSSKRLSLCDHPIVVKALPGQSRQGARKTRKRVGAPRSIQLTMHALAKTEAVILRPALSSIANSPALIVARNSPSISFSQERNRSASLAIRPCVTTVA